MSDSSAVQLELVDGLAFRAEDRDGLQIVMETDPAPGAAGRGPAPVDLLLMALGGCTAMDVLSILRKMRQDVTAYSVQVRGPRAPGHPRVFTELHVEHCISGFNLDASQVKRAITLSASKYCPVGGMLRLAAPIRHTYRLLTPNGAELATGFAYDTSALGE